MVAQAVDTTDLKKNKKKKPGPNNPEEATRFELIDDTTCKILRVETEKERTDQQLCKDLRVSMDNIMQAHHVLNHLEALPGFKKSEGGEQFAISELFRSLQSVHNASAKVAGHLAFFSKNTTAKLV